MNKIENLTKRIERLELVVNALFKGETVPPEVPLIDYRNLSEAEIAYSKELADRIISRISPNCFVG